jgi:hypothetical protein
LIGPFSRNLDLVMDPRDFDFESDTGEGYEPRGNAYGARDAGRFDTTEGFGQEEDELLVMQNFHAADDTENEGHAFMETEDGGEPDDVGDSDSNIDAHINLDDVEFEEPPEHGIIAVGKVLNALDLIVPGAPAQTGRLFFKILFASETSRASAFRCKTPMFTSSSVPFSQNPEFEQSFFKFETTLPLVLGNNSASNKCGGPYGEIIVSLMYITENGVQQTFGDACFDLSKFVICCVH